MKQYKNILVIKYNVFQALWFTNSNTVFQTKAHRRRKILSYKYISFKKNV